MNNTLVTVIVPAYNHEKYVLECLDSINNQTYRDFQWIVVDDCSQDKTPELLKENKKKYGYELILHDKNMGLSATLTETIRDFAKGEYLVMCASDDMFLPNKIEAQLKFLQNNPQYVMCYSRSIAMNEKSENFPNKDTFSGYKSGDIFEDILCRKYHIGINIMYRTKVFAEVGYFEPNILAEDYYLYCKIARKYKIGFLDEYLHKYRVAELSTKRDPWKLVMSHRQTVDMFKDDVLYPKAVNSWEVKSSLIIAGYKKYKLKALKYFVKNMDYFFAHPKNLFYITKYLVVDWK